MTSESSADRLRKARQTAGVSVDDVAAKLGITVPAVHDLEMYPDELNMTVSLAQVCALAALIGLEPRELLVGPDGTSSKVTIEFAELARRLAEKMKAAGVGVEEFGQQVGWDVKDLLTDAPPPV